MMKIKVSPRPPFRRIGIAGLGLIGGSLAKALIPFGGLDLYVFDKDPETLKEARKIRRFTAVCDDPDEFAAWPLDLAYLCLPVHHNLDMVERMGRLKVSYAVTDAGSTKAPITQKALEAGLLFCGGHPISGREVSGFKYADADLWRGILYILTPHEAFGAAGRELAARLDELHSLLQCRVRLMSPAEHDRLYGLVSHLPWLSAVALAGTVMKKGPADVLDWVGTGFKDSTRIAAAAPPKWVEIAQDNAENLVEYLDELIGVLGGIKEDLRRREPGRLLENLRPIAAFRQKLQTPTNRKK